MSRRRADRGAGNAADDGSGERAILLDGLTAR
jgi:hypothetical protein